MKADSSNPEYARMRSLALSVTAQQLGVTVSIDEPYAVVMDINLAEASRGDSNGPHCSIVAMADGTASMYMSKGMSVLGAGERPRAARAARFLIKAAKEDFAHLKETSNLSLPDAGLVQFLVLTGRGTFHIVVRAEDNGKPVEHLFIKGNDVITEIRCGTTIHEREARSRTMMGRLRNKALDQQLLKAVNAKQPKGIFDSITQGADPNIRIGDSTLFLATIGSAPVDFLRVLLQHGADIDLTDATGRTALQAAAALNRSDLVEFLLNEGANPNLADSTGLTPLMCGAYIDDLGSVTRLLASGAQIDAMDNSGYTALMFAAQGGSIRCVQHLIQAGSDVNAADNIGATPIMFASQGNFAECVEALVAAGADVNRRCKPGLTARGFCKQNGHAALANWLEQHGGLL